MRRPVMMEYLDAQDARTSRIIEPRTIRRVSGELMLVAHCQLRQAQRTFKLERIVQLTRIEEGEVAVAAAIPAVQNRVVVSCAEPVQRSTPRLNSDDVQSQIDDLLLSGVSQSMGDAEGQFLDAHLPEIAELAGTLSDEEFCRHEAVKLLFSHGSRPWEDALT
jgi:predicted DNA-binding transcriptional regulator YafY